VLALRVEIVVHTHERLERLGARRQGHRDLAGGMRAQPVRELPRADLNRRVHARFAEGQNVVVLATNLEIQMGYAARRLCPGERHRRPFMCEGDLGGAGHHGIIDGVGRDVGGGGHQTRRRKRRDQAHQSQT